MKLNACHLGCGLIVLALAAGCQSTGGQGAAAADAQMTHVQGTSQAVLSDVLAKAGLTATDLVMEVTVAIPPPANGDPNPKAQWGGCFAGQEKAVLQADDRVLLIAKTLQCDAVESRYVFNPFIRVWTLSADRSSVEGNLLWVLFNGKASEFAQEVNKAQDAHELLGSLVKPSRPITAATLPAQVTAEELRNDVVELGLTALAQHLQVVHADGQPCNPDVHLYVKPAAGK